MRIITERVPAKGRAGVRIRASAQGREATLPYPVGLSSEEAHRLAARNLLTILGGGQSPLRPTKQSRRGYTWHTVDQ